jgi:hypothetical protein
MSEITYRNGAGTSTANPSLNRLFWFVIILAFGLRVAAAVLLPDQGSLLVDAVGYREAGKHFWETFNLDAPLNMPLYPVAVAAFGPGWIQVLIDISLSTALVWLIFELAMSVFADIRIALLAAFGVAIYPHFIFFSVVGLTETLFMTLLAGAYVCWYRGQFVGAAMLSVLSILTRPTLDPLVPVLILYFSFFIHRLTIMGALKKLLAYILIYCALMSPWWLHNYRAYGAFVRLELGDGLALFSGNNPSNPSGGLDLALSEHTKEYSKIFNLVERNKAVRAAALNYISNDIPGFIERCWLKFLRFWRLWPYTEGYSSKLFLIVSLLSFVPALFFALYYLFECGLANVRLVTPLVMFGVYLTAIHMVFLGSIRYRIPLEPFLVLLAAGGLGRALSRFSAGRRALNWLGGPAASNSRI